AWLESPARRALVGTAKGGGQVHQEGLRHDNGSNVTVRGAHSRTIAVSAAILAIAGAAALGSPSTTARAARASIVAPTYVRTIGSNGESTIYPSGVAVDSSRNVYVAGTDSFTAPRDVATDGIDVYVADTDNADVQVLSASTGAFIKEVKAFGSG